MTEFKVDLKNLYMESDNIKSIVVLLGKYEEKIKEITNVIGEIGGNSYAIVSKSLNETSVNIEQIRNVLESMEKVLDESIVLYETAEKNIKGLKIASEEKSSNNHDAKSKTLDFVSQYEYTYSDSNIAVPIDVRFLDKTTCLDMAERIIAEYGEDGICNGMNKKRIAKELYAHAVGYYAAEDLERVGIDGDFVQGVKESGEVADIGLGDDLDIYYNILWNISNMIY